MIRKQFFNFCGFMVAFWLGFVPQGIGAEKDFPTRPVEVICPYSTGGSTDLTMRAMVAVGTSYLGQPLIPTIKAGAGGTTGTLSVARAKPDGYTILISSPTPFIVKPLVEKNLPFKPEDFTALGRISASSMIVCALSSSRWKTLKDFLADAKKNPGKYKYSSGGVYAQEHINMALLSHEAGVELIHVPTGGGGPALTMLLGGHVDISTFFPSVLMPHINAGTVRPLAVIAEERLGLAGVKDVPTLKELGIQWSGYAFNGMFAPKGVPPPILQKLRSSIKQICEDKSFIEMMDRMNEEIRYLGGEDFERLMREQRSKIGNLVKTLK